MIHFISFADSEKNTEAFSRICVEAKNLDLFDSVTVYNESMLDETFYSTNKEFIKRNRRGFGYWIWKPQILIQELRKMNCGDTLVYTDAGCTLNKCGITRLKEYIESSKIHGIVGFHNGTEERIWTKNDLFEHLNYYTPGYQVVTGAYILTKSEKTTKFAELWGELCLRNNYHFVDDSRSLTPNHKLFREHRHDQSIFSILIRQFGGHILNYEIKESTFFPISATRKIKK